MKLYKYKLKAANAQYQPNSEIVVVDISEINAIERAESLTQCQLSIVMWYGVVDLYNEPCVISNTFDN